MRYLVIEGNEYIGKDLQGRMLAASVFALNIPLLLVREPGGVIFSTDQSIVGEWVHEAKDIRTKIKGESGKTLNAKDICQLFYEVRKILLNSGIRQFEERNPKGVVISQRSFLSTFAIQCYHDNLEEEYVLNLQRKIVGKDNLPALGIYLSVSPEELKRRAMGDSTGNWQDQSYDLARIHNGYLSYIARAEELGLGKWIVVNGEGTINEVHNRLLEAAKPILPTTSNERFLPFVGEKGLSLFEEKVATFQKEMLGATINKERAF